MRRQQVSFIFENDCSGRMKSFCIEASEVSPEVLIDSALGIFEIKGVSLFDDPVEFYLNLAKWIHAFSIKGIEFREAHFKFLKLNNASSRWILLLIKQFEKTGKNKPVEICWHYKSGDKKIYELGEEYRTICKLPFSIYAT